MRFLITGAAGFIGFHLTRRLLAEGHFVAGVDGLTPYYDVNLKRARLALLSRSNGFRFHELMLEDFTALRAACEDARPDVIVLHQYESYLEKMMGWLAQQRIQVPRDVGVALLDKNPDRGRFSGICQDPGRMGAVAVEMLLGRLLLRDFGLPESPKVELVQGDWNEGASLRPAAG